MTDTPKPPRKPRSTAQAIELLERYASLEGQAALAEDARNKAIADSNAVADAVIAPIAAEMAVMRPVIEAWWRDGGSVLAGDCKSMELGGCMIGTKMGARSLELPAGGDKAGLAALQEVRWGKPFIRVTYAIDKVALRKALSGGRRAELATMGFREQQAEIFFVERHRQGGTIDPQS